VGNGKTTGKGGFYQQAIGKRQGTNDATKVPSPPKEENVPKTKQKKHFGSVTKKSLCGMEATGETKNLGPGRNMDFYPRFLTHRQRDFSRSV